MKHLAQERLRYQRNLSISRRRIQYRKYQSAESAEQTKVDKARGRDAVTRRFKLLRAVLGARLSTSAATDLWTRNLRHLSLKRREEKSG